MLIVPRYLGDRGMGFGPWLRALVVFLGFTLLASGVAHADSSLDGKRILFVGNSITHNTTVSGSNGCPASFPQQGALFAHLSEMFDEKGMTVEIPECRSNPIYGGSSVKDLYENPAVIDAITNGNYDFVVIQPNTPEAINEAGVGVDNFFDYGKRLIDLVRAQNAVPVIYRTWLPQYALAYGMQNANLHYARFEAENQVDVVNVADAINVYYADTYGAAKRDALYTDSVHGTAIAMWTFALTFYKYFTGDDPANVDYLPTQLNWTIDGVTRQISNAEIQELKSAANQQSLVYAGATAGTFVRIVEPQNPFVAEGQAIRFSAVASEGGSDLSSDVVWMSTAGEVLGQGPVLTKSLGVGEQVITAEVETSAGTPVRTELTVTVYDENSDFPRAEDRTATANLGQNAYTDVPLIAAVTDVAAVLAEGFSIVQQPAFGTAVVNADSTLRWSSYANAPAGVHRIGMRYNSSNAGSTTFDVLVSLEGQSSSDFAWVTGEHAANTPALPMPARNVEFVDPVYGTTMRRMTDVSDVAGTDFLRNDYSRRSPLNIDNTRALVYGGGGYWHMYDVQTSEFIKTLTLNGVGPDRGPNGDAEPEWDPVRANVIRYHGSFGGLGFFEMNVDTMATQVIADFTDVASINGDTSKKDFSALFPAAKHLWGASEGRWSNDRNRVAMQMDDERFTTALGIAVYELSSNSMLAAYSWAQLGSDIPTTRPNNTSISPSGKWVLVQWAPGGTWAFNVADPVGNHYKMWSNNGHMDWATGANGNDVVAMGVYNSEPMHVADVGNFVVVDVETRERKVYFSIYNGHPGTAMHVSGTSTQLKDYVLVSTYNNADSPEIFHQRKLFFVRLSDGEIFNVAHNHWQRVGSLSPYWAESQASLSLDGTKVIFNSNWGDKDTVETYIVDVPPLPGSGTGSVGTGPRPSPPVLLSQQR